MYMYVQPILKKFLPHTVRFYKTKLITNETSYYLLESVRFQINPPFYTDKGVLQQNGVGNYKLYYDMTNSHCWSMKPGNTEGEWVKDKEVSIDEVKFAIHDTIRFDFYPYVSKIVKIEPIWGETQKVHHYELALD